MSLEPISPTYPNHHSSVDSKQKPQPEERLDRDVFLESLEKEQPITAPPVQRPSTTVESIQTPSSLQNVSFSSRQLYSPTQVNLNPYPLPQQFALSSRDYSASDLGSAPPVFETASKTDGARATGEELSSVDRRAAGTMADTEIKEGDQVAWQWSGGRPGGEVEKVATEGSVQMETKRGNVVEKHAEPDNPAVKINREGHDVVKKASELEVEEPGDQHKEDQGVMKTVTEDDVKGNGEPKTGEKRSAEESSEEKKDKEEGEDAKKQKTETNGEAPKKKGRPAKGAGNGGPKKETKKREPKKAATESGEPRRSGRVASKS